MFKKTLFFIVLTFVFTFSASQAFADEVTSSEFTYLFHLYYDGGQLFADRNFQFTYDLLGGQFVQEHLNTETAYKGEVFDVKNKLESTFNFDPKNGQPSFTKGKISVRGPYFADAAKVNFYNDKERLLLTVNVGGSSFCDDNGICNSDTGENYLNCPSDCKIAPTPTLTPKPQPSLLSRIFSPINLIGLVVIVTLIFIFFWLGKKRNESTN